MSAKTDELELELLHELEDLDEAEAATSKAPPPVAEVEDGHPSSSKLPQQCSPPPTPVAGAASSSGRQAQDDVAGPSRGSDGGGLGALATLTEPLLLGVLLRLSPDDLLALAQCSHVLRALASDGILWRRLYLFRWAKGPADDADTAPANQLLVNWKRMYTERDGAELADAMQRALPGLADISHQMATAKRSECAPPTAADDPRVLWHPPEPQDAPASRARAEAASAAAFRAAHGLPEGGCAQHPCAPGSSACAWHQLGPATFICAASGYVHACGEACSERMMDAAASCLVCPVSGRCFETRQVFAEEEEVEDEFGGGEAAVQGAAAAADDDWNAEETGMGGRLGRAFYAGYMGDEDFLRRLGVRL